MLLVKLHLHNAFVCGHSNTHTQNTTRSHQRAQRRQQNKRSVITNHGRGFRINYAHTFADIRAALCAHRLYYSRTNNHHTKTRHHTAQKRHQHRRIIMMWNMSTHSRAESNENMKLLSMSACMAVCVRMYYVCACWARDWNNRHSDRTNTQSRVHIDGRIKSVNNCNPRQ